MRTVLVLVLVLACGCGVVAWATGWSPPTDPGKSGAGSPGGNTPPSGSTFPWQPVLGYAFITLIATALCYRWELTRPFWGIIAAAGIATIVYVAWRPIIWGLLLAVTIVAALTFAVMWLLRSGALNELVTNLQLKRNADPAFKAAMNDAMTGTSPATSAIADKIREPIKVG